jgi:hypothetical protein
MTHEREYRHRDTGTEYSAYRHTAADHKDNVTTREREREIEKRAQSERQKRERGEREEYR